MAKWIAYALVLVGALGLVAFYTGIGANLPIISDLAWTRNGFLIALIAGATILFFGRQTSD